VLLFSVEDGVNANVRGCQYENMLDSLLLQCSNLVYIYVIQNSNYGFMVTVRQTVKGGI
jgi:hypothetical protein